MPLAMIDFGGLSAFLKILILFMGVVVPCLLVIIIFLLIRKKAKQGGTPTLSIKEEKVAELKKLKEQGTLSDEEYRQAIRNLFG